MIGPVAWQHDGLKRELWGKQQQMGELLATHSSVAVKGCHGSGKTYFAAGHVTYELSAHDEAIVLVIAPTLRQVKTFWSEVTDAISHLPYRHPLPTTSRWEISPKCYAQGFSSSKGVNAQGFHGKRVLIIADEAIGISPDLWDAIEGVRSAGDVRILKLCNPTVPGGPVYDDFTRNRGVPGHATLTFSAFDTPNLAGLTMESLLQLSEDDLDIAPMPWLIRRRWVKEMYYKWGPQNPRFQSRVLGDFPTQATDAVFSLAWIESAGLPYDDEFLSRWRIGQYYVQVGIDIAGPGDDETVAYARLGPYVIEMEAWPEADPRDKCIAFLQRIHQRFPDAVIVVMGDAVGIGYYFLRHVATQLPAARVLGFVANSAPMDPVKFWDKKAEAYFTLREWMQAGQVHGIADEDTKAQLSDCKYRERAGRIEIEHKDEVRTRTGISPDRAEALIMAYCRIQPSQVTVQFGGPVDGMIQISPV